jgi:uncharacterized protein
MPNESTISTFQAVLRRELPALAEQYHVASLGLFGSYLRGEQRADSDLDVLATFDEVPSLFQIVSLANHLTDLLGVKVDLVLRDSLKPHIGQNILRQVVAV